MDYIRSREDLKGLEELGVGEGVWEKLMNSMSGVANGGFGNRKIMRNFVD